MNVDNSRWYLSAVTPLVMVKSATCVHIFRGSHLTVTGLMNSEKSSCDMRDIPSFSMNYEAHYAQRGDRFRNDQLGRASETSLEVKFY